MVRALLSGTHSSRSYRDQGGGSTTGRASRQPGRRGYTARVAAQRGSFGLGHTDVAAATASAAKERASR